MADCPFCQLLTDGLPAHCLYENGRFFVLLDRASMGIGHCMVIPKRHAVTLYDLDESEYTACFLLAKKLTPYLQQATGARAIGYIAFGSGLPHAHLHLVPHNHPQEMLQEPQRVLSEAELQANTTFLKKFLPEKL